MRIGFLGLGNMGAPMAANLAKAGFAVQGYDISAAATESAAKSGITIAETIAQAASNRNIIITMLPNGALVRQTWAEILLHASPGTLLIDCSTIDVFDARAAHEAASAAGMAALDAPVSGGTGGAAAATLTFMCGGTEPAFAAAHPALSAMGRKLVHCGTAGAGQAAKICNNMILGISMIAVAEAFVLGEKLGLSHQALFDVAATSSGQCWALTTNCPVPGPVPQSPANRAYTPGFAAALMLKDLNLAQHCAKSLGADTEMGRLAAALYAKFVETGSGGQDFSAIINAVRG